MTLEQPELPPSEVESRPLLTAGTRPARRPRRGLWAAVVVGIALLAWLALRGSARKGEKSAAPPGAKGGARAIPVAAVAAGVGNLGVYLNGLGTVTALNTVTVHTRVDGQLVEVAFREGQIVRPGELLARIDPRPFEVQLAQAEGQKAKDQAALENARVDLKRYEVLAAQDAIPRQQLDTQAATVHQDEASVASDQGQVDAAKLNLTYSRITAPIGGRVGLRLVDAGNIVHAADASGLLVITQLEPIAAVFTIPSDQLPPVLEKKRAGETLEVDAWDRDMKKKLAAGTLSAIDNQIDTSTGTVKLKAEFSNSDGALFPNQFVNARLLVNTLTNTILVPSAAIQRSGDSTFVWVVGPDSSAMMRPVQVAWTEGDQTAVSRGLAAGESVVVEGVDNLQPGAKVTITGPGAPAPEPARSSGGPRQKKS
jgi:multidrug efflux system membrane fusion protein